MIAKESRTWLTWKQNPHDIILYQYITGITPKTSNRKIPDQYSCPLLAINTKKKLFHPSKRISSQVNICKQSKTNRQHSGHVGEPRLSFLAPIFFLLHVLKMTKMSKKFKKLQNGALEQTKREWIEAKNNDRWHRKELSFCCKGKKDVIYNNKCI